MVNIIAVVTEIYVKIKRSQSKNLKQCEQQMYFENKCIRAVPGIAMQSNRTGWHLMSINGVLHLIVLIAVHCCVLARFIPFIRILT